MLALFAGNAEMRRAADELEQQILTFNELAEQVVGDGERPLFTTVLPGEVAELPLDGAGPGDEITAWLRGWQAVDLAPLLTQGEVRFRSYKSGEPRDLSFWFGPLADGSIDRLRVRDPYALNSERNRRTLAR